MKRGTGIVAGVRVSHDDAALDDIAAARVDRDAALDRLLARPDVEEAFVFQTCHRVEAYAVAPSREAGRRALSAAVDAGPHAVATGHEESLRHLLRVAAGLESVVLGEDEVLGQFRDACKAARRAGGVGPVLGDALTKALHVGERARSETAINEGSVSLGSAAVRLAERERDLTGGVGLVVGAGEMGALAARALAASPIDRVIVANRSLDRAAALAAELDCEATWVGLDALPDAAADADVVVTATGSPEPILSAAALADAEAVVVDLGQPRDVAPEATTLDGVDAFDLDDLESVTATTRARRRDAAAAVEEQVDRELDHLLDQFKRKRADEVIGTMYESADRLKSRELSTAMSQLEAAGDLSAEQREVVASLADSLVSKLLAAPTKSLRDAAAEDDWETIATALHLFDPEFEGDWPVAADGADAPRTDAAVGFGDDD